MRISVSSADLGRVVSRFRPRRDSKIEFNVNGEGLDIVANQAGWLTLARWCLVMAHPHMHEATGPDDPDLLSSHWHFRDYLVDQDMLEQGRAIEAFWPLGGGSSSQGVRFWRAAGIGRDFFSDQTPTGNSPTSDLHARECLFRHRWLDGMQRSSVEERLGAPVGEEPPGVIHYRADVPGEVIEITYSNSGKVEGFSF